MNKTKSSFLIKWPLVLAALVAVISCEGPVGPPGPPGSDGLDGVNIVGEVFEVTATFTAQGEYSVYGEFGFEIYDTDKVLIFQLAGEADGRDVWRPLPWVVYHNNGIFSYSYDFTYTDFSIFLEGNFDFSTLESGWLQNQVYRVLIIPADAIDARIDFSDLDALLKRMDVKEDEIRRIAL